MSYKAALAACTLLATTGVSSLSAADTVVMQEEFTSPLSPKLWKGTPDGVSVDNGALLLKVPAADTPPERAVGTVLTDTEGKLNFLRHPVAIELDDLDIQGTSADENGVFMLFLSEDKNTSTAKYVLQLRVDRTGNSYLWLYYLATSGEPQKRAQMAFLPGMQFPLKKVVIQADSRAAKLTITDAAGTQSDSREWNAEVDPSKWDGAELYLMLRAVSKKDPGSTDVSIGALKAETSR
ncbi:hypothetical protein TSACC_21061 [Terrimicrobium sacchariphilum]|uniref:Uncharacterized protein n=1 Tax=Terrimicrobium sacchariphilum TaxID=690879 RepID=A0A146G5J0_TERSA|nr:hypothetical protein [Terrimicrobium sacchariphilum]GAT32662.1 hypothetical protein TSACC_21061 [Terrimicrobium sacchariphilum]